MSDPNAPKRDMDDLPPSRTDRSLLRRLREGEQDAATSLYLRYAQRLQALARAKTSATLASRVDPEDVVQSVFRTFFRRASAGHYDVPEGDELWKLLLVIALNKIRTLAAFHGAAKRDLGATVSLDAVAQSAAIADQEEALRILEMIIDETLADFAAPQREIIRLRIAGHSVNEIAEQTGRAKRSVERVLQQFRARLGGLVSEAPPDEARAES